MADPYQTLGVARGADDAAIKKAYRKLAKELHPDRNKDNPAASARFSEVTGAYDLLSDAAKRAQYDRGEIDGDGNPKAPFGYGAGAGGGFRPGGGRGGFEFGDAGGGGGGDFDDAAALKPQRITLAGGKAIDLKLTADAVAGTPLRLAGQGEAGPGGTGDATVTVEVKPHRFFTRDGDDVRVDLPIRLDEAVAGGRVKVPTVESPVMLTVPPHATSGKVLRLKGRGFHRRDGTRGDQLVTLLVDLPADDAALAAFVESWTGDRERNPRAALGV